MKGTVIYLSHGGGPMPVLGGRGHEEMIRFMKSLPGELPEPDEILVISAHWEQEVPTVISGRKPPLIYDYFGFPEAAYDLQYPAPGSPRLAEEVAGLLNDKDIACEARSDRGFDHGLFIPLSMMYPRAHIPVTQLSLVKSLDAEEHLELGKALRKLTEKNILIIGSGFSFHNMNSFSWNGTVGKDESNDEFQNWLIDVCTGSYNNRQREEKLIQWEKAPNARYCHPREEHLLPLHLCYGISGEKGEVLFDDYILGKRAVAFKW